VKTYCKTKNEIIDPLAVSTRAEVPTPRSPHALSWEKTSMYLLLEKMNDFTDFKTSGSEEA
jgi:hypothetical protein